MDRVAKFQERVAVFTGVTLVGGLFLSAAVDPGGTLAPTLWQNFLMLGTRGLMGWFLAMPYMFFVYYIWRAR